MNLDQSIQDPTADHGPTGVYKSFYEAFDWLNAALFDSELPDVVITMQRQRGARGYFSGKRFGQRHGDDVADEIALNPSTFADRTDREIISTLLHEMAHEWQDHFGNPGRGRYHNKQWASKMIELGLMPSHTGEPGGKKTGDCVSHYIIEGGPFAREWEALEASGYTLDYQDRARDQATKPKKSIAKYVCPGCEFVVRGEPGHRLICLICELEMPSSDQCAK